MKKRKNKVLQWVCILFLIPADILYLCNKNREVMNRDLERLLEELPYEHVGIPALNYALLFHKPFRSIFYYRTQHSFLLRNLSRLFFKPLATIEIMGSIGAGFRISHNYAVIHPQQAGEDFFAGHGVTIGKGKRNPDRPEQIYPIIGDHVSVYAGAIVIGAIRIGDYVQIGAGAVVNRDIPSYCTVVGNPCRIITKRGMRVE